jgi:hypothetical protein
MSGPWERYQTQPDTAGPWQKFAATPEEGKGSPLPANAGVAKLATTIAGMPVDAVESAVNLTRAAQGAVAGAFGKTEWMPPLLEGSVGGSQWLQNVLRRTGQPGLSPDNPTPKDALGTAQYNFVARGGVLPGGALPAAGSMAAEAIGGPEWAGVGAMLPSAAVQGFNELRTNSLKRAQEQSVVRDATLKQAQDAGYVLPPSQVQGSFIGNRLESLSGKAALDQSAVQKNQQITNRLAREEVGLPENSPITPAALDARRDAISGPYKQLAAISPSAAKALERLKDARSNAKDHWASYDRNARPEDKREAVKYDQQAQMLETFLEKEATRRGKPQLVDEMREARQGIAKTYDVERALNVGDGNVDARILGRALDRGKPLSGGLEVVARFAEAYPQLTRSQAGNPTAGVGALEMYGGLGMGLGGASMFGPGGWALGALPFIRPGVREALLSGPYQRTFARPNYDPAFQPENSVQSLGRTAILENDLARR